MQRVEERYCELVIHNRETVENGNEMELESEKNS